jgi:hypothetical protein
MSLSILVVVEVIEITLVCLKNVENEFICFRACRIHSYVFRKSINLIYVI